MYKVRIRKALLNNQKRCSSGDFAQKIFLEGVQKHSSVLTTWESCTWRTRPTLMWMVVTHVSVENMEVPVQGGSVLRKRLNPS